MGRVKLKLTKANGDSYGYLRLWKDRFIGGVNEQEATIFHRIAHRDIKDAFYYEVRTRANHYLDLDTKSGLVYLESPFVDVHRSRVWAWIEHNGHLCAVAEDDTMGQQKLSLPRTERQKRVKPAGFLFTNFSGEEIVTVEVIDCKVAITEINKKRMKQLPLELSNRLR